MTASHRETVEEQTHNSNAEARMVLPGVQTILGFQLIAVFNERFAHDLSDTERLLHAVAFALTALSMALIMTPAAYHRIAESRMATERLVRLSSLLLAGAMVPLALGLALDAYIVFRLALQDATAAIVLAAGLLLCLVGLWFVLPYLGRRTTPMRKGAKR